MYANPQVGVHLNQQQQYMQYMQPPQSQQLSSPGQQRWVEPGQMATNMGLVPVVYLPQNSPSNARRGSANFHLGDDGSADKSSRHRSSSPSDRKTRRGSANVHLGDDRSAVRVTRRSSSPSDRSTSRERGS